MSRTEAEREVVGVIAGLVDKEGNAYNVIYWAENRARKDRGKVSGLPPLGPYAQHLYDELFKKWGR